MPTLRPMLAATLNSLDDIPNCVSATPKIDGFRVYKYQGDVFVGRNGERLQNQHVYNALKQWPGDNVDGELDVLGQPFHLASGLLRRRDGTPPFRWRLFDSLDEPFAPYLTRLIMLNWKPFTSEIQMLRPVTFSAIMGRAQMLSAIEEYINSTLELGFEGVMFRRLDQPYKNGRSTLKEFGLVKWKPFEDDEAIVLGFVEKMHNENEATLNPFGLQERSSHAENQVPAGTLGSLLVSWKGRQFHIGTGFDDATRHLIWKQRERFLHRRLTFKYQKHGMVDLPRSPVFKAFVEEGLV